MITLNNMDIVNLSIELKSLSKTELIRRCEIYGFKRYRSKSKDELYKLLISKIKNIKLIIEYDDNKVENTNVDISKLRQPIMLPHATLITTPMPIIINEEDVHLIDIDCAYEDELIETDEDDEDIVESDEDDEDIVE